MQNIIEIFSEFPIMIYKVIILLDNLSIQIYWTKLMLRFFSQVSIKTKHNENIQRHKVKHLRAKVRSLLPTHICQKHQDRNKRVTHLVNSKQFLAKTQSVNSKWKIPLEKDQQLFFQQKSSQIDKINSCQGQGVQLKSQVHLFQKLTKEEIQQIEQNKHYFLGNATHIQAFDRFLKKTRNYEYLPRATKARSPRLSAFFQKETARVSANKSSILKVNATPSTNFRNTSINLGSKPLAISRVQGQRFSQDNYEKKFKQQQKKLQFIQSERVAQEKIKLRQKQQKFMENWITIQSKKLATLRQNARRDDAKQLQAKMKRMKRQHYGEVVQLNEKIRKMFIEKMDKTFNQKKM